MTPPRWPENLVYLDAPRYHVSIKTELRTFIIGLQQKTPAPRLRPPVIIKVITDKLHPAYGQRGLFASKKIPPRKLLLYYLGEVHADDRPNSDYDLSLYRSLDGDTIGVDASYMGNEARFVNDYRGIRDKPNATFEEDRSASGELRMSIWSSNAGIGKGDEILVSYGKSWWRERTNEP